MNTPKNTCYFSTNKKLSRFLNEEIFSCQELSNLIKKDSNKNLYLFGGAIRDTFLNHSVSDLDFVFDGNEEELFTLLNSLQLNKVEQNKFGGYRVYTPRKYIDIWSAQKTWAFTTKNKSYSCIHDLLDTTLLNWDSIIFSPHSHILSHHKDYFYELFCKKLFINLQENPNLLGSYTKIVRFIQSENIQEASSEVLEYLFIAFNQVSIGEIMDYSDKKLDKKLIHSLYNQAFLYHENKNRA